MTIPDLRRALGVLVAESGEPPVDLLQRVAARRRRRNRRRATLAAAIAAVLGAGAVPVVRAVTAEPPRPPGPAGGAAAAFRLPAGAFRPPAGTTAPLLTETWPGAVVTTDLPPVPDGDDPVVVGRIGADLLVGAGAPTVSEAAVINSRLWLFSPADRRYREAADLSPLRPAEGSQVAVAGQRIVVISRVYDAKAKGLTMVTTFARPGAARTVVATAPYLASVTGFGADDRYAYWQSTRPGSGTEVLYRTRLDGGEPGPAPGFDGLRSDGTGWSRNAAGTVFRDLSGGERRSAVRPPGADEFRCVPAFCLGHDARGWFVQKLDGAGRTALPGDGAPTLVGGFNTPAGPGGKAADGGLLLLAGGVLLDPVSGRYGSVAREPHCEVRSGRITTLLTVSWRTRIDGVCTGPRTTAYLAPAD